MNSSPVIWPVPGVIYFKKNFHHVNVPSPLLCMNLIIWAEHRLDSLREQVVDKDYTRVERTSFRQCIQELEFWLESQDGPICFHTHELLSLRSEALPWIVGNSDLDVYLECQVLPLSSVWETEKTPYYAIWSDESHCSVYVSHSSLFRTVVEFSSPEITCSRVSPMELEVIIGQMVIIADCCSRKNY